jgi:predicted dehydrogenase
MKKNKKRSLLWSHLPFLPLDFILLNKTFMQAPIRWGILATGKIAHKFATGLAALPDAQLQAVASRDQSKAEAFAQEFGAITAHGSYEALAADPLVDIIYVASPHALHHAHTLLCLRQGKHVLCEKPMALNARQAEEMFEAARLHNCFLMEAMWTRFLPAWQEVSQWLAQGLVGEVRLLQADFCFRSGTFDPQSRNFNLELGGGALLDIGIYPIALAYQVFGEDPVEVKSTASLGPTGVDEQSSYLFRYANGAQAVLSSSFQTHGPKEAIINGTQAAIRVPLFWRASEAQLLHHMAEPEVHTFPLEASGLQYQAVSVMADLRAGRTANETMPPTETLRIMRMMDRLREDWGLRYPGE